MNRRGLCLAVIFVAWGCGHRSDKDDSCSVIPGDVEGEAVIVCPDGSRAPVHVPQSASTDPTGAEATWEGDFVVSDEVDMVELQAYTVITGTLWIRDLDADVLYAEKLRKTSFLGVERASLRSIVFPSLVETSSLWASSSPNLSELHFPLMRKRLRGRSVLLNTPAFSACEAARMEEELCADGSQDVEPMPNGGCAITVERCSRDPEDRTCLEPCVLTCGEDGEDIWSCSEDATQEESEAAKAPGN